MPHKPGTLSRRPAPRVRGTSCQRGYGRDWQHLSLRIRAEQPLCVLCERAGRTRPATQVHHLEPVAIAPGKRMDTSNLLPLCASCHRRVEAGIMAP